MLLPIKNLIERVKDGGVGGDEVELHAELVAQLLDPRGMIVEQAPVFQPQALADEGPQFEAGFRVLQLKVALQAHVLLHGIQHLDDLDVMGLSQKVEGFLDLIDGDKEIRD